MVSTAYVTGHAGQATTNLGIFTPAYLVLQRRVGHAIPVHAWLPLAKERRAEHDCEVLHRHRVLRLVLGDSARGLSQHRDGCSGLDARINIGIKTRTCADGP